MKIFKYPVEITDEQFIALPKGANILTVQAKPKPRLQTKMTLEPEKVFLWAIVDPEETEMEDRHILILGTGHDIPEITKTEQCLGYLGTVQLQNGTLVFHIFEVMAC